MGTRTIFRRGDKPKKGPPTLRNKEKKTLHGKKGSHKEKNIAKKAPTKSESSKKALPYSEFLKITFWGGRRHSHALLLTP